MEPEKKNETKLEETDLKGRTPVKERIRKMNKKTQASPGKFPLMKQQMLETYYKRKSPKASKARERQTQQPEEENKTEKSEGTNNSPLLGVSGKPEPKATPSKGSGLESEECERTWDKEVQKKALKALERWPPDPGSGSESPKRWKPKKRLQKSAPMKGTKERKEGGDFNVLKKWLQKEKEGSEAPKTCLGPRKALEPEDKLE